MYPILRRAAARRTSQVDPGDLDRKPLLAGRSPHSMRKVVVLPAPFGPSSPKISPRLTEKETWSTAVKSPNFRTRSVTSMTTSVGIICLRCCFTAWLSSSARPYRYSARLRAGADCVLRLRSSTMNPSSSRGSTGLAEIPSSNSIQSLLVCLGTPYKAHGPALGNGIDNMLRIIEQAGLQDARRLALRGASR